MKSIRYIHTKFLAKVAKFEGFRSRPYKEACESPFCIRISAPEDCPAI